MWALACSIFVACKWLTWMKARGFAQWWRHAAYWLAWPGMDANAFLGAAPTDLKRRGKPGWRQVVPAIAKASLGIVLLGSAAFASAGWPDLLRGWIGMLGVILMLHFGIFDFLSWVWRRSGVDARPLMDKPLASVALSEFWGRRWNTAFRDLTFQFLFRPLTARFGGRWALAIGFIVSGLVHDLVISLPAKQGHGGPTLYFVLQGTGLLLERSRPGRKLGLGVGLRGRCCTLLALILPVPLLFHPPFVRQIVLPMLDFLKEISHA